MSNSKYCAAICFLIFLSFDSVLQYKCKVCENSVLWFDQMYRTDIRVTLWKGRSSNNKIHDNYEWMNYRNEYEYAIFLRELKTNVYTWMCVNMLVYLSRSTHSVPGAIVVDSPVSCSFNSNPHLVDHCTLKFVLHGLSGHSLMSNQSWFKSNAMPHLKVFSKTNSRIACFTLSLIDTLNQIVS